MRTKAEIRLHLFARSGLLAQLVINPRQGHVRLGISRLELRGLFQFSESSF